MFNRELLSAHAMPPAGVPQAHRGDAILALFRAVEGGITSLKPRAVAARTQLFRQGDPARSLHLLLSGALKLAVSLHDGRSQGLRIAQGPCIVDIDTLEESHYPYGAEALTPLEVCTARRSDLLAVLASRPELSLSVVTALGAELRRCREQICSLGCMTSTERVAAFLLALLPPENSERETVLPVSRTDIADILSLTPETVSRVLTRLKREGVIDLPANGRRLRVLRPGSLRASAGG